jgi:Zn-dependent protease with chaperone function
MSLVLHGIQLFLLAGIAFLGVGSLTSGLLVRACARQLSFWEPRARHRALVLLAALPVIAAMLLLLSASLPSLVSLVAPGLDHCRTHDDGHAHLCFVHLPKVGIDPELMLGLIFLLVFGAARAAFAISSTVRAVRALDALVRTGEERRDLGVTVIETAQPMCLAGGLWRPRVILSRGLLACLGENERAVVLAHERAHVRRRDALVASIARGLAAVHLPGVARWLVRELEIAAEQACDEEAACAVADRVAVASAILSVERAAQHAAHAPYVTATVAFGECAVARRVESLLAEAPPPGSLRGAIMWLGVGAAGLLGLADQLHHVTESILSVVVH